MELSVSKSSPLQFYSIVAFFLLLWYTTLILRRRHLAPKPPGPTGLPILGSLPFLHPELHTYFTRLSQTYGPIFRLNLGLKPCIVVSSPSLAREVFRDLDHVLANHEVPAAGRVLTYGGCNVVWSPLGPTWRMLRKVSVHKMLSPACLDAVYTLRRREVRATVSRLLNNANEAVDVGEQIFLTVLNVTTSMIWGGTMEGEDCNTVNTKEFKELAAEILELVGQPNVSDLFPFLARFDLQGIERKMDACAKRFDRFIRSVIDKRREGEGERNDFLEVMLRMEAEGGDSKTPFTMSHLKSLLIDMVVGGTDTTATAMEWAMAEMMQNPEIMRRAQEELDQVVGGNNVVEERHIPKLHYLRAVIKEGLRLHAPVPLLVPHCPSSSCTIGGYSIPEGCRVLVNVWAIQRDPSIWEDPLKFKPERFLDASTNRDFNGSDFSYLPFGSGRRICMGISMAERMASYLLDSLLHSFDWKLPLGTKVDLSGKFGIVLKKAETLVLIPTPRLPSLEQYL